MFVPWKVLNDHQYYMDLCGIGPESNHWMLAAEESQDGADTAFWAHGNIIATMNEFKYPGCILTATDDDWLAVVENLSKARNKFERLTRILVCEGSSGDLSPQCGLPYDG